MSDLSRAPIVIAAGGTGGHFFPAEALAAALIERGHRVVLMTDRRTGRRDSGAFAGTEQHVLSGAGLAGRSAARAARGAALLLAGTAQAACLLRRLRPAAVIGFGGYPCVPPMLAARVAMAGTGRPRPLLVLHEQNAVPGRANRALSRIADLLALGFDATARIPAGVETLVVGNPVRPALLGCGPYRMLADHIPLAVVGGSLGASVLAQVVPEAISRLGADLRARLLITQQCRPADLDQVRARYAEAGVQARLAPFFEDMAGVLGDAALVISRAGASTVAELAALGRPAILVPLPGAIDDHQRANAATLAGPGGGWMIEQPAFTPEALAALLAALLTAPARLAQAAAIAAAQGRPEAARVLAQAIEARIADRLRAGGKKETQVAGVAKNEKDADAPRADRRIGRHATPAPLDSVSN